ncbi:MAG: response regulator transcription factor [Geminicoccaceae bacterium]
MRIAVIEDNSSLAKAIAYRLCDLGHAVDILHDGDEADQFLASEGADLIVLDIKLPGQDGLQVLRNLRARGAGTPVILLTAKGDTEDRVKGLDAGADDYLIKPFEMDELEARIRALSRRRALDYGTEDRIGSLVFDRTARRLSANGQPLDLPRRELAVFECLLERRGRLVPKTNLIDYVYGIGADVEESAIEPHISRLRKRLSPHGVLIKTARGLGYMLEPGK